ncbi:MAG: DEAD/DEAH box helicase [Muribaculaceae bacterium]|nr:DEAD/DEAH box helicase [Muribaculaceae bacterium]
MKEKEIRALLASRQGIETLNPMQEKMLQAGAEKRDIILLSPTGSGKTVAFGVPLLKMLKDPTGRVQAVVIAPSRELVTQIAAVLRDISGPFRVVALYGGHNVEDEVNSLNVTPDIIVATPGRLLDHIKRRNVDVMPVRILVLDEFDKSLELGFEEEMAKIVKHMKNLSRIILTSATDAASIPDFLPVKDPQVLDFLDSNRQLRRRMRVRSVRSDGRDKLDTLLRLLRSISQPEGPERTIIFVNHRESAERVAQFLRKEGVACVLYHGALDQRRRESALQAFNCGARPILVATDLAARGLDIEGVRNVVHYHLPLSAEAYTHRNGRTARVANEGDVYLLLGPDEELKEYMEADSPYVPEKEPAGVLTSPYEVLYISAGRREKLSRGDILGFIVKECGVEPGDVGKIAVFDHYSLVSVMRKAAKTVIEAARSRKIKGEKRRVGYLDAV